MWNPWNYESRVHSIIGWCTSFAALPFLSSSCVMMRPLALSHERLAGWNGSTWFWNVRSSWLTKNKLLFYCSDKLHDQCNLENQSFTGAYEFRGLMVKKGKNGGRKRWDLIFGYISKRHSYIRNDMTIKKRESMGVILTQSTTHSMFKFKNKTKATPPLDPYFTHCIYLENLEIKGKAY